MADTCFILAGVSQSVTCLPETKEENHECLNTQSTKKEEPDIEISDWHLDNMPLPDFVYPVTDGSSEYWSAVVQATNHLEQSSSETLPRVSMSNPLTLESVLVTEEPLPKLKALDGTVVTIRQGSARNFIQALNALRQGKLGYNKAGSVFEVSHTTLRKFYLAMGYEYKPPKGALKRTRLKPDPDFAAT